MRLILAAALVALTAPGAGAQLAEEASGIRTPARHTAGESDQFMGHPAPDGHHVYFVSDRHSTLEPWVVDIRRGAPEQVFEHDADLTAPRVSPDGERLLFVSYRRDALGDVAVRDLEDDETRYLTGAGSAEVQAFWFPDGESVGVVARDGLHADYRLLRVRADGGGEPEVLLDRNVSSPAVSPDGRWIAYVPLARGSDEVGIHFAMRAAEHLELIRPGDGRRVSLPVDLPGVSGFPAFSPDGRWLYFSQYLNDTNFDGRVDGDDHSVLFRVPFSPGDDEPVGDTPPQQLTSAGWSCQYPAPAPDRLVMTCAIGGSLDVWSLPPDGAVDAGADEDGLEGELHAARDHWEKLLLLSRLLAQTTDRDTRIERLRRMIRLHLELREHGSADWYARRLADLARPGEALLDLAAAMRELIGFRREESRLVEGQLSGAFLDAQRKRLKRLRALEEKTGPAAALARLVSSGIHDVIGEKTEALESFESVDLEALEDPFVLFVAGDRATRLLRPLGRRERLLEVYRLLSSKLAFDSLERLRWADRLVRTLFRGVDRSRRQDLVEAWLERVEEGSEAALLLRVHGWLNGLTRDSSEWVRAGLFEIYRRQMDADRRKALVLTTVERALAHDDRYLAYEFANSWASWLKRAHPERKYAEALYTRVMLERGYDALGDGAVADARGTFYSTILISEALEPHVGFIETRLREGFDDARSIYAKRWERHPDPVARHFVEAYLIAREVPDIRDTETLRERIDAAVEHLRAAAEARPQSLEAHHLWGTLMHHLYAATGSTARALEAHTHYHVALGPAESRPRYLAPLLHQIGLLQAALGNHRIAIRRLERRVQLPFADPRVEVSARLALARSLFHTDRDPEAADEAARALALVDAREDLSDLRPLAVDRAALYHQIAGRHEQARDLYGTLLSLLEGADPEDAGRPLNLVKARIGRASASLAMGAPADALPDLERARGILESDAPLEHDEEEAERALPTDYAATDYSVLVAGLEARGHRALDDLDATRTALERRRDLLAAQEPIRERLARLGKTHYDLAEIAWTRDDREATRRHLEEGLRVMDRYTEQTSTPVTGEVLHLLQAYAELHLDMGVPRSALEMDLRRRLREAFEFITTHRAPAWDGHRFLLAQYLTLLDLEQPDTPPRRGESP
ncbi:MAG: hypothetical protein ACQEXJ_10400 [Myxococcota bacterium]